jgi:hypothetical protein
VRDRVERGAAIARRAIAEHRDWLAAHVEQSARGARIGEQHFAQKLALTLDTDFAPDSLLARAQADLERVTQLITDEAGQRAGVRDADAATVRSVLDELAADAPTDETILGRCRDALADTTRFVRDHDLVTVHDDPIVIVEMPERRPRRFGPCGGADRSSKDGPCTPSS